MDINNVVEASFVVVAQSHNPSIVNPDWLLRQGIVSENIGHVSEAPLITPAFSRLRYEGGLEIVVEESKLIVSVENPEEGLIKAANSIALSYVDILRHIPYKAVGLNIKCEFHVDDAPSSFFDHFFSNYIKEVLEITPPRSSCAFSLSRDDGSIANIKFTPVVRRFESEDGGEILERHVIAFEANVHYDIEAQGDVSAIEKCLESYVEAFEFSYGLSEKVIGL